MKIHVMEGNSGFILNPLKWYHQVHGTWRFDGTSVPYCIGSWKQVNPTLIFSPLNHPISSTVCITE